MVPKRVLIVNNHSLLLGGVESLLEAGGEFAVTNVLINDLSALIDEIEQWKPDVTIIDEAISGIEPHELIAALDGIPAMRLIVLDARVNRVGVFDKYEHAISNSNQLMNVIRQFPNRNLGGFVFN